MNCDRNPLLDDAGTHTVTPRSRFIDGKLHQLWLPCDWTVNSPEWRKVESEETAPPVVNLTGNDGGTQT